MLEDIIGAIVRAQVGDLRKRTLGAVLEVAALGMTGLATVFLFVGFHTWLSARVEPWLSALIVAGAALIVALILMLVGQSLLHRRVQRRDRELQSMLGRLGVLSGSASARRKGTGETTEPGPAIIGAALAAGILLGRSFRR